MFRFIAGPSSACTRSVRWLAGIGALLCAGLTAAQAPVTGIAAIGAGPNNGCAVTAGGAVLCWGSNVYGVLGDETVIDRSGAVRVNGLGSGAVAAGAGGEFACALIAGGAVKCWGHNEVGQLGTGGGDSAVPVTVSGLGSGVAALAVGDAHACAILAGGALKCWGINSYGQIGDGSTSDRFTPVTVNVGSAVVAVAAGVNNTCAVTTGGAVLCWGANYSGQVGDGTSTSRAIPTQVSGLTSGYTAVAVGTQHACARASGGALKCWGEGGSGALGNGGNAPQVVPVSVTSLAGPAVGVTAGNQFTCAWFANGAAQCWGNNNAGSLGDGTTQTRFTPGDVSTLASGVTAVAAGSMNVCALANGAVRCWGSNTSQQLGDGSGRPLRVPSPVTGLQSGTAAVAVGGVHACALTTGGGARCWGLNGSGQLGVVNAPDSAVPITPTGLASGVAMIRAGYYFTCALTTGGGVKCWGTNSSHQLGGAGSGGMVVDVTGLASGVTAIAAGSSHACALTAAGGVKCWGYNYAGALGDGTTTERAAPVDVAGLQSGVTAIATGDYFSCALLAEGTVKCWGYNGNGQLGDGSTTNRLAPVTVAGLTGATGLAAGLSHVCALTTAGKIRCWGGSGDGQVGEGTLQDTSHPVDVAGISGGATAVAAGGRHSCAIVSGAAWCWGRNLEGQLGDGSTSSQRSPTRVIGLDAGVSAIAAGSLGSCAVAGGAARCWGASANGQAGNGVPTFASTPVAVVQAMPAVTEFYNTALDNYFITADPVEAAAIDSGSAGPGWSRTGEDFNSAGPIAVCRFYGSISPGPNSHFYTANATECNDLVHLAQITPATQPRWNFESNDFLTAAPVGGACPAGMIPVWRAYNNGAARHVDSNHRITSDRKAIDAVVARGWIAEGVVMCAQN